MDQWNRTEGTETSLDMFSYLIFNKEVKTICWRKRNLFKVVLGKQLSVCRRLKLNPYVSSYSKLKSKWIQVLNIKTEALNLVEDKIGKMLEDKGVGKDFLNGNSIAQKPTKGIISD